MLAALQIRDIVLIDGIDLSFEGGLTVLTGETGAGKSIILDALGLALGARADRGLLRAGAKSGSVSAEFRLPADHPALALAQESAIPLEGESLLVRRVITEDGRARAFVNDEPVSQGLLRQLGALLVEVHGQNEDEGLTDPAAHRALLDNFVGIDVAPLRAAFARWQEAALALEHHTAEMAAAARDADYVRHAADELEALAPKPGEESALAGERAGFAQAVKLGAGVGEAEELLARDGGVSGRLGQALRRLERLADKAEGALAPALAALERARAEAAEAEALIETLARQLQGDPSRLERIEERLYALRAAGRKFNTHPDGLAALGERFAERNAALSAGSGQTQKLAAACAAAKLDYLTAAAAQCEARLEAARRLDGLIAKELKPLKLDKASFETEITPLDEGQWSAAGTERVRFLVSTNPGTPKGPLSKIASGGERARFLLALKAVLARGTDAATLIFDEVDQGVGGAVAAAVGERLARLSRHAQLLIVTHSPQLAARADHHLRIVKAPRKRGEAALVTRVEPLDEAARREEIARMLSGSEITNEARAAAERLIGVRAGARG
jgi:DNA repair protein RecN (Recombination protein N)